MFYLNVSKTTISRDASRVVRCVYGPRTLAFPPTVRSADQQALRAARSLKSLVLNKGLKRLGGELYIGGDQNAWTRSPFQESAIVRVSLSATVQRIDPGTFENCRSLRSISLPEGVKYIGVRSFAGTALSELTLPKSIVRVDPHAFLNEQLTVRFAAGTEAIPKEVLSGGIFGSLVVPASVREIRHGACARSTLFSIVFEDCSCLENIGTEAFCECKITQLKLPDSVKVIGKDAFRGCRSLATLLLSENTALEEICNNAFCGTGIT